MPQRARRHILRYLDRLPCPRQAIAAQHNIATPLAFNLQENTSIDVSLPIASGAEVLDVEPKARRLIRPVIHSGAVDENLA